MVDVIICGFGTVGKRVAFSLNKHQIDFISIDKKRGVSDGTSKHIIGDATSEEILIQAGVKTAKTVITVTDSDLTNAFIALLVKNLNKNVAVLSMAHDVENVNKLDKAGVDYIFSMAKVGRLIAKNTIEPYVADFLEMINLMEDIEIMPVHVSSNSRIVNKTIKKAKIRRKTGAQIIAIRRENKTIYSPSEEELIRADDYLLAIGKGEQIKELHNISKPESLIESTEI
jgi:voltage-gated potassium channel